MCGHLIEEVNVGPGQGQCFVGSSVRTSYIQHKQKSKASLAFWKSSKILAIIY